MREALGVARSATNHVVREVTGGAADCVVGLTCEAGAKSLAEQHPEVTQGVVDAAAGVVDGVTMGNAGWVTRGKVVNESSGWHVTGRLTGTALLVPFAVKGGPAFTRFATAASYGSGASSCVNGSAGVWSVNCARHLGVGIGLGGAARPFKSIDEQMFNSVTLLLDPVAWLSGVWIDGTEC